MTDSAKLGGFKVLKDVSRISLVSPEGMDRFPLLLCRTIAENRINLPYVTIVSQKKTWSVNLIVDLSEEEKTAGLIREHFGKISFTFHRSAIISVFPHKKNPEISGRLLQSFERQGVEPDALASSPSAISVVVRQDLLQDASNALFEPFSFSAYRTPEDWKMAQKGKEKVFKEVVASYQEKRPGVYGLEYGTNQDLVCIRLKKEKMAEVGRSFRSMDCSGLHLAFLVSTPSVNPGDETLAFCLPHTDGSACKHAISEFSTDFHMDTTSPVMTFSMNGPHFGDRYGITSELLSTLDRGKIPLLALSCTVASITGVVHQHHSEKALRSIEKSFEVPTLLRKE